MILVLSESIKNWKIGMCRKDRRVGGLVMKVLPYVIYEGYSICLVRL